MPEEEFGDKSKAYTVTKGLVCLQAGWFYIQSIVPIVKGLPLTLLEIHALIHIIHTFYVYQLCLAQEALQRQCNDQRIFDLASLFALDMGRDNDQSCYDQSSSYTQIDTIDIGQVRSTNPARPPSQKAF